MRGAADLVDLRKRNDHANISAFAQTINWKR